MRNMPLLFQVFMIALWLFVMPTAAGGCLRGVLQKDGAAEYKGAGLPFSWVSGQALLWACFQFVCVPCVLLELDFCYVVYIYGVLAVVLAFAGGLVSVRFGRKGALRPVTDRSMEAVELVTDGTKGVSEPVTAGRQGSESVPKKERRISGKLMVYILWACFFALLLLQLVQAVRMVYADGDDAYYVAVSTITENAETMYRKLPYTGGTTNVDIRHGLAPFPIWIAFLSRASGIRAVSAAHIAVPLTLIPMTYAIFYLLGRRLFAGKEKRLPMFLIFTELLTLFGDYSFYTVENFMLARSRQGKSALGSIVIPMLVFLLFVLMDRLSEKKKSGAAYWVLLFCTMTAGCLCSTMGAFLLCLFVAVAGVCAAVSYRQWRVLPPLALCCVPCVCFALLYLLS